MLQYYLNISSIYDCEIVLASKKPGLWSHECASEATNEPINIL